MQTMTSMVSNFFYTVRTRFTAPKSSNDEIKQTQTLLSVYLWSFMGIVTAGCIILMILDPSQVVRPLSVITIIDILYLSLYGLIKRGWVRLANILTIGLTWLLMTGAILTGGGLHSPAFSAYLLLTFLTGITLGVKPMLLVAVLSTLSAGSMEFLHINNLLPEPYYRNSDTSYVLLQGMMLFIFVILQFHASSQIRRAFQKAQNELNEHILTQKALSDSQNRFASIFENSPIPTALTQMSNNHLLNVNPMWLTLTGLAREEAVGKNVLDLNIWLKPEDRAQMVEALKIYGRVQGFETLLLRKDKAIRNISVSATKINLNGNDCIIFQTQDITEKLSLERSLLESNERFDQIARHIPEIFWIAELEDELSYVSPAYESIFGRPAVEIYQNVNNFIDLVLPEDRPILEEAIRRQLQGESTQTEYRIQRPDGMSRWIHDRAFPVFNPEGQLQRIIGVATDITEQKSAEAEVLYRQKLLEKVIHSGRNITSITNLDLCLQEIHRNVITNLGFDRVGLFLFDENKKLVQGTYGTSRNGQIEKNNWYSVPVEEWSDWQVALQSPNGYSIVEDYQATHNPPSSSEMYGVKQHVTLAAWSGDKPVALITVDNLRSQKPITPADLEALQLFAGYVGLAIENSRLHTGLEKLVEIRTKDVRRSEATYRALFEKSNDGIFLLSHTGEELHANQHAIDMLGYTNEEYKEVTQGKKNPFTTDLEQRADADNKFAAVMRGEKIEPYERVFTKKNGDKVHVEINLSPIRDETGTVLMIQSLVRDITQRKLAELTLRQANHELERALRMKDEFLANMSHELRTPLNAILGLSESLLEETVGSLNSRQQKYLGTINESGQHLLELINDILDLAKIGSGQVNLVIEAVNIRRTCEASIRIVEQLAKKKHHKVELQVEKGIDTLQGDERRIKQMIVNLLSNAVKFTPENGKVGINVMFSLNHTMVNIEVWDTGIGIEAHDQELLFQPFIQLDAGLARESSGTGLGLALVSQMAHLHGGSVSVNSLYGEGSRFTLSLPLSQMNDSISTDVVADIEQ